jgi:acyl-CoA reductase-like NAD-dependent aldehyde dehydrogenase
MALVYLAGDALETPSHVALHAPWDHTPLGTVGQADLDLARRGVGLAHDALPHTARLPAHVRRDLLRAISEGITARADALARTITLEAGKPISFSRSEVERAACRKYEAGCGVKGRASRGVAASVNGDSLNPPRGL